MDEVNIGSNFIQGIIVKIIKKVIRQKTGYYPELQFNDPINLKFDGDKVRIHLNIDAEIRKEDLQDMIKNLV